MNVQKQGTYRENACGGFGDTVKSKEKYWWSEMILHRQYFCMLYLFTNGFFASSAFAKGPGITSTPRCPPK